MSIKDGAFKSILSQFATGVTVVTVQEQEDIHGLTVNAFSSVSLDPQLVLICIEEESRTNKFLDRGSGFTVNILSNDQKKLSQSFARPGLSMEERLRDVSYSEHEVGGPHFKDVIAWLSCRQQHAFPAGDHIIYVGRVIDGALPNADADPLVYLQGDYRELASKIR